MPDFVSGENLRLREFTAGLEFLKKFITDVSTGVKRKEKMHSTVGSGISEENHAQTVLV